MPEKTRAEAVARAKEAGIPASQVVKGEDGYYVAPAGIHSSGAKQAYAACRADGGSQEKCAKIAWSVEKQR